MNDWLRVLSIAGGIGLLVGFYRKIFFNVSWEYFFFWLGIFILIGVVIGLLKEY